MPRKKEGSQVSQATCLKKAKQHLELGTEIGEREKLVKKEDFDC